MALSRNGSDWHEAQRVKTGYFGDSICSYSESRVLISECVNSTSIELFRVESK